MDLHVDSSAQLEGRLTSAGGLYELRTEVIEGIGYSVFARAPKRLAEVCRRAAAMGESDLAAYAGRRLTYRGAIQASTALAEILRRRFALTAGTRVAIASSDPLHWIVAWLAIVSAGAVAVLPSENPDIRESLQEADCALIVCDPEFADATLGGDIPVAVLSGCAAADAAIDLAALDRSVTHRSVWPARAASPTQDAMITFTSGTTGAPKPVVSTHLGVISGLHNMMLASALASAAGRQASPTPVAPARRIPATLVLSPMSHIAGYAQLLLTLMIGGRLVFLPRWDPRSALDAIRAESVRSLIGATPTQLLELTTMGGEPEPLASVRLDGGAAPPVLLAALRKHWPQVALASGYGLTETNGSIASIAGAALLQSPSSSGRILPSVDVRVVTADGADALPGTTGELWIRGANLMRGYRARSGEVSGLAHGWFHTGDLATIDAGRHLRISGRITDQITVAGKDFAAVSIEQAASRVAGVVDAAAFRAGPPSGDRDAIGLALVIAGTDSVILPAVVSRVSLDLGIPAGLLQTFVCAALPKTRSGKTDRSRVSAVLAAQSGA